MSIHGVLQSCGLDDLFIVTFVPFLVFSVVNLMGKVWHHFHSRRAVQRMLITFNDIHLFT